MDLDPSVVWDFAGTLVGTLRERPRQLPATVSRVDPDGTVWLSMPGADGLVPASTTADVGADDAVTVEWWGNAYHVTGNRTSPSVGTRAAAALRRATAAAAKVAGEAKGIADAVGQHFWADDNGVHVSNEDGNATGERNILMNSLGILLRQGSAWLASFSDSAVAFYDGLGNTAANIVAQFGADGARIGRLGAAHSVIDANGQRFYGSDGTTQLANIGYGDSNAQSGTSTQPYFTFGERETTTTQYSDQNTYMLGRHVIYNGDEYVCIHAITTAEAWNPSHWALAIGGYSTAGGRYSTASGFASHAQNYYATAMGSYSSAGGFYTKATGTASHAEGGDSIASGYGAHAEGSATKASGNDSHAQNSHTIAASDSQTAMGRFNANDPDHALEVGNGTADDARSNAFAVGWDGTLSMNGVPMVDYIIEQGTSGIWTYRKWSSGIAECWGTYTASIAVDISAAAYGGYRSAQQNVALPSGLFSATPQATGTFSTSQGAWLTSLIPTNATSLAFYLSCGSSLAAANRPVSISVHGRWQ